MIVLSTKNIPENIIEWANFWYSYRCNLQSHSWSMLDIVSDVIPKKMSMLRWMKMLFDTNNIAGIVFR